MKKSRNIPIDEYFDVLQREYLSYKLRYLIYDKKDDKAYYQKIMSSKSKKINDIASKNKFTSIFDSQDKYFQFWDDLLIFGVPNIVYKNSQNRADFIDLDIKKYFSINSKFRFIDGREATLLEVSLDKMIGTFNYKGKKIQFLLKNCKRLFKNVR